MIKSKRSSQWRIQGFGLIHSEVYLVIYLRHSGSLGHEFFRTHRFQFIIH